MRGLTGDRLSNKGCCYGRHAPGRVGVAFGGLAAVSWDVEVVVDDEEDKRAE